MKWGKRNILLILCAIIFSALFLFSHKAKAADDHVVINEVYAVPASSAENDWIELYNPTDADVDLTGYYLIDDETSSKAFYLSGVLQGGDYLVIEKQTGGFTFDLSYTDETVFLKQKIGAIDTIIDKTSYEQTFKSGISISRIPNGSDTGNDANDFRFILKTPDSENLLLVYSSQVYINEIVPQPATSSADEFIELYNSELVNIDLSGWQLDDIGSGGSSPFTIPAGTTITAGGYLIFYNSIDHITLNDSGDSARLIDPNGDEKSLATYGQSTRGQSYSKFNFGWQWTTTLTPLSANILTVEIETSDQSDLPVVTDIAGAKNQSDGTLVQINGTVSAVPGKLSTQYFYIQNGSSGIQVYNYNKDFPAISAGDEIQVTGEMGTISNERRIKTSVASDIIILSTHPPPEPIKISISQISTTFEGEYITVTGTVTKTSGSTFYIHGSGEVQVSIRMGTGIKKPRMSVGDRVQITGILSEYNGSYRILPIVQSDVNIIPSLPNTGVNVCISLFSALISIVITWNILQKVWHRQNN